MEDGTGRKDFGMEPRHLVEKAVRSALEAEENSTIDLNATPRDKVTIDFTKNRGAAMEDGTGRIESEDVCGETFDHKAVVNYEDDEIVQLECLICDAEWEERKDGDDA